MSNENLLPLSRKKGTHLWINRLLLLCAGADRDILEKYCERKEINSHIITGILLIFTGLLATLGGGYLIHLIFDDPYSDTFGLLSIIIGLLWGYYFFTVDRGIVIDMKPQSIDVQGIESSPENQEYKLKSWSTIFKKKTYQGRKLVFIRLSLAIINSIIVSKGLELYIFKDAVRYDIQKSNREELSKLKRSIDSNIDSLRKEFKGNIRLFTSQNDSLTKLKALNEGSIITLKALKKANNTIANADGDVINQKSNLNQLDLTDDISIKQNRLSNALAKQEKAQIDASRTINNSKPDSALKSLTQENILIIKNLNLLKENFVDDTLTLNRQMNDLIVNKKSYILQDSIGLEKHNFLPRKYSTMANITEWANDPYNAIFGWAIMILLFSIEITPVLRKLLMPKGEYDKALEMMSASTEAILRLEYGKTIIENDAKLVFAQKNIENNLILNSLESDQNLLNQKLDFEQSTKIKEIQTSKEILMSEVKYDAEKVYMPLVGTWKETSLKFFEELNDLEIKMIAQYINRKKELSKINDIEGEISSELNKGMLNAMKDTSKRLFNNYSQLLKNNKLRLDNEDETNAE